jgi:hypothetical protein
MRERIDSGVLRHSPLFLATIGLVEVVIACVVIVGIFAAASGPFDWSSGLQILTCAVLGGLLWHIDRGLHVEAPPASGRTSARRAPACR